MPKDKINRMKELNELLAKASDHYYNTGSTIMSDAEYDKLYNELEALEAETGIILSGSRTQNVGYEVSSYLPKVRHPKRMLSLDKTRTAISLKPGSESRRAFSAGSLTALLSASIMTTASSPRLFHAETAKSAKT